MMKNLLTFLVILSLLVLPAMAAFDEFYPFEAMTGKNIIPDENLGGPWLHDDNPITFGDGKDAKITYDDAMDKLYFNDTPLYFEEAVAFGQGTSAVWPGTATRIAMGSFIDTAYGLKNSTANKAQVNISANMGLRLGTGSTLGSIEIYPGNGINVGASGIEVDPTDLVDTAHGIEEVVVNKVGINLTEDGGLGFGLGADSGALIIYPYSGMKTTSNGLEVNLSASSGLEIGSGATEGALKIDPADASLALAAGGVSVKAGALKHLLADGTASGANVVVVGMATGDELISIVSYTTKASIATMNDRSLEYAVGSGVLTKSAGTNETGNQLDIWYWDRT